MSERSVVEGWDYGKTWYHGSPVELTVLRIGSTITQDLDLARVFSHKPTLVSISDDGKIQHDGYNPGFLYRVAEDVRPDDIYPHPRSTMEYGKEWLTTHELRVTQMGPTQIREAERLTKDKFEGIKRQLRGKGA